MIVNKVLLMLCNVQSNIGSKTVKMNRVCVRVMAPRSKVNLRSHCQKAHQFEVALILANCETDCQQRKGIIGQKDYVNERSPTPRSKVTFPKSTSI